MSRLVAESLRLLAENKDVVASAIENIFNTKTMATLKISDLSVGDWVGYNGKSYRAVIVDALDQAVTIFGNDEQGDIHIDQLAPIPITAEILEKNGLFRHERDDDNQELIVLSNHFIMARTYTDVDCWRVLIYDEEIPSKELFNGIIYSVHQLQHALRLAGVEKEIVL